MSEFRHLPLMLRRVAEAHGLNSALRLADEAGGTRIAVPEKMREDCALAKRFGPEIASTLIEHYGELRIMVHVPKWKDHERRLREQTIRDNPSMSVSALARATNLCERQVHRIRAAQRDEPAISEQKMPRLPLFDFD